MRRLEWDGSSAALWIAGLQLLQMKAVAKASALQKGSALPTGDSPRPCRGAMLGLGLIPGAGGTQRLPRLTGIEKAIDMMHELGGIDRRMPIASFCDLRFQ